MKFNRYFQERSPGFQLAPMIDIVFLNLIFFMVASVWAQWETKLGIDLPITDTGEHSRRQPGELIVNVDVQGRIFINDVEQTPATLQDLLLQVVRSYPDHQVIIRADRKTPYEAVVLVLDVCRQTGIWSISFASLPNPAPAPAGP